MDDQTKAKRLLAAAAVFNTGCANTIDGSPPETCEECRDMFLKVVSSLTAGEERYMTQDDEDSVRLEAVDSMFRHR